MRKLHWVSLALIASPIVAMHACGGDDTTPGAAGAGGGATVGTGGAKATGGGGAATTTTSTTTTTTTTTTGGGGGGTGGGGGKVDGGGGAAPDGSPLDVTLPDVVTDGGNGNTQACTDPAAYNDAAVGLTCNDYCSTFMAICNNDPSVTDSGGFFANMGACLNACHNYTQPQVCCRAEHANNAAMMDASQSNRTTHCPHAAGRALCP